MVFSLETYKNIFSTDILEPAVGPIVNILHNAVTLYKRTIGSRQTCTPSVRWGLQFACLFVLTFSPETSAFHIPFEESCSVLILLLFDFSSRNNTVKELHCRLFSLAQLRIVHFSVGICCALCLCWLPLISYPSTRTNSQKIQAVLLPFLKTKKFFSPLGFWFYIYQVGKGGFFIPRHTCVVFTWYIDSSEIRVWIEFESGCEVWSVRK